LECLWVKFSEVLRVDDKAVAEISSGYPLGQNVALGGVLPDGTDGTNELSFMCLEAQAHIRLLQPNLTVRLHAGTPDDFLKAAVRVISLGNGMPQLLNDELIIPSLVQRGIPIAGSEGLHPRRLR
jgi:pyruvate-formate lyase